MSAASSLKKTVLVLLLEDILFPGTVNSAVDAVRVQQFLKSLQKYAKSHSGFRYFGVSALKLGVVEKKLKEFGLDDFFSEDADPSFAPGKNVLAVNEAFIRQMTPEDRTIYEHKCVSDAECKDEYARQVQLLQLMEKLHVSPENVLFVGHDYWFDGFYTRRFSKVDVAFIESALTSKGHLATERIEGLWHIGLNWEELLPLLEGNAPVIDYKRLDEFVVTTISKELFGGQGFSLQKKVIDLRKIKEKNAAEGVSESASPSEESKHK